MQNNEQINNLESECVDYASDVYSDLCHYINIDAQIDAEIKSIDDDSLADAYPFARVKYKENRYIIEISTIIFDYYSKEKYGFIQGCLYHEFVHILDAHHASASLGFNPLSFEKKSKENILLSIGYNFWTEFYAYYKLFRNFKADFKGPSMFYLIKRLKRLIIKESKLTRNLDVNIYEELYDDVCWFSYLLAERMGVLAAGADSYYRYCDKTINSDEYKYLSKFITGMKKYISKMLHGTYGKHMKSRLIKLGEYIFKKIYAPFGMELIEVDNEWVIAYYPYEED